MKPLTPHVRRPLIDLDRRVRIVEARGGGSGVSGSGPFLIDDEIGTFSFDDEESP
jgi:hypothetical protein